MLLLMGRAIDHIDSIERLQRLREAGALTLSEFEAEKARLLAPAERPRSGVRALPALIVLGVVLAGALGVWLIEPGELDPVQRPPAAPSPTPASPVATAPPPAAMPLSAAEQLKVAFEAATGRSAPFVRESDQGPARVEPVRLLELPFGPVLLTRSQIKDGCHACSGAIGVYYLSRQGIGFTVRNGWPDAVKGWGWGAAPQDWSLTTRFTSFPAIFAEGGYTGQGYTCGGATLTELRPEGPVTSDLIGLHADNLGNVDDETGLAFGGEPKSEIDGKIVNVRRNVSFEVSASGTEKVIERYVRKGTKFVRTAPESRLSC